jgi:hypothetical protein
VTGWKKGKPLEEDFPVVLGLIADSPNQPRRARLLDADGEERGWLSGVLAWEEGEGWVRLSADGGDGLSASLTIPLDADTRCMIEEDGTMTCTLPNGAQWITTPLVEEG